MTDAESPTPGTDPADRKRGGGAKLAYETLRDEILDLVLAPGEPIDEASLAERLAMSRTPVREALVRLAGEGLVTMLPNRSTIVAPVDFPNLYAFFDALTLMYRVTTRLAAEFHQPADLDAIRARQAVFARAVQAGDTAAMITHNRDFHAAIAEAGRNSYYTQLFVRLLDEGRRILRLYYYPSFSAQMPHPYILEHEAIIAAVADRDVELCDTLAREHADQIVRQIQEMIARDRRQHLRL
ncbi:GntR family transcriptional regulator [Gemmobacter lanyuensis]|uniref:GntR family transcriptional regulator n=1 Tax=Gemmobacter lanyuensis TaxID=1054497 RepID=A0A918MLU2_9RHOB|nr:GntR family transcriptional regulator [Gemmobacter lanyuensis]GGW34488.1 GntR family transcriptional regulator [Gemmobacter lanyuensis]